MPSLEQFINDPGTTLGAAISSSGATSITVASSSGYGSGSVNFVIAIEAELLRVTNISGTTWTVTRGIESTTAATHANGTPVNAVVSAGSIANTIQTANVTGAFASLPGTSVPGQRYSCTDSPYEFIGKTSGWQAALKGQLVTLPPSTSWTWDQQGGSTAANTGGPLYLKLAPSATNLRMYYRTAPSAPYTVTVRMRLLSWGGVGTGNSQGYGIGFRDASGKIISFLLITQSTNRGFETDKWTDADNVSGTYASILNNNVTVGVSMLVAFPEILMRIQDNSTNLIYSFSIDDGANWEVFDTRARTDFFASGPTQWGIIGFFGGSAEGATVSVLDVTIG